MVTQCVVKNARSASGAAYAVVTSSCFEHAAQLYGVAYQWFSMVSPAIDPRGWRMCSLRWLDVDEHEGNLASKSTAKGKGKKGKKGHFVPVIQPLPQGSASSSDQPAFGHPGLLPTHELLEPGQLSSAPSVGSEAVTYRVDLIGLPLPEEPPVPEGDDEDLLL